MSFIRWNAHDRMARTAPDHIKNGPLAAMKSNRQGGPASPCHGSSWKKKTIISRLGPCCCCCSTLSDRHSRASILSIFQAWNRCWTRITSDNRGRVKTIRSKSKGPARWAHGAGNCSGGKEKAVRIPIFGPAASRIRPNTLTLIAIYLLNGSSALGWILTITLA